MIIQHELMCSYMLSFKVLMTCFYCTEEIPAIVNPEGKNQISNCTNKITETRNKANRKILSFQRVQKQQKDQARQIPKSSGLPWLELETILQKPAYRPEKVICLGLNVKTILQEREKRQEPVICLKSGLRAIL